ncbi:NADH-quinone oxidoreductase subunit NuoF [Sulfurospirillum barnesii]|uniref:NADH:ubiquinone oxidoreductase, NADH-binding (51 kD) subunit n=1 Tax=Sulfurospirillum barnesii (strain ATCC 700032 / DSM 10660 / SES-3) TaxID=760154 RepID=I3XUV5_SULBS|nr:NADH-quinone oxidoreductase subunit NuoF [Sulfurospirillum barnesii]AFL67729.1 NADH:ubiquinone oxidoreductase, NADH-binding (51 kD) subunit [Sulfurospirillum barnesii SES-3]
MMVKIVSKNFDIPLSHTLRVARENGRYGSLVKLFSMSPDAVTSEVEKSGLRGKGGGGAHTGEKWRLIPRASEKPVYLVVNADESEPGTFKDRQILEFDPHLLLEGIICSSYAIDAHHAYIYIRGEYVFWAQRVQEAIDEAYAAGILGERILGHDYTLHVTLHRGAGAYICGEKTALLESLEGKRGHPRLKPKGKEPEWFFGCPTVVNNVETIASVPFIIEQGYEAYRAYGTAESPGTMLFGISGHVEKPGVYELPYGTSMKEVIYSLCGGITGGKKLKAVIPGGSSVQILRADEIEAITLDYESLKAHGSSLGTGGMIVMDEEVSIPEAMKNLFEFYHHESCGQCTPCREGTGWVDNILEKILQGKGTHQDIETLLDVCDMLNGKTICVFAPSVAFIAQSYLKKFREEFEALLK